MTDLIDCAINIFSLCESSLLYNYLVFQYIFVIYFHMIAFLLGFGYKDYLFSFGKCEL